MKYKLSDIEEGFDYVSFQPLGENQAYLSRETGRLFLHTDVGDNFEELPDDIDDGDAYLEIPHKNELDLGTRLVDRFTDEHAPELAGEISEVFSRSGAYRRFKDLLDRNGLLETWYAYERDSTADAIRQWCQDNGIELAEDEQGGVA